MRITKEPQSKINIINTLRNLNKLNPTPNIDLSNLHSQEMINNTSNPIKVNIMKNQKKLPIDFIYNDQKSNIKQKEGNNTRNSLIFTQEKNNNKIKENDFHKKISMSPKLTLRYEDNEDINKDVQKNKQLKNTPKKTKYNLMGLLSKNYAYNKKKPNNALTSINKKKEQQLNNNINDDNISVVSFNSVMTDINAYNIRNNQQKQNNNNKMPLYNQNLNMNQIKL